MGPTTVLWPNNSKSRSLKSKTKFTHEIEKLNYFSANEILVVTPKNNHTLVILLVIIVAENDGRRYYPFTHNE